MKRIIFPAILACLAFSACDRTVIDGTLDFDLAGETTISVVKTNSVFSPDGGEGYIVIKSDTEFNARSSRDWCTLSVENDTINVSVEPYSDSDSRFSQVVVKNEAGDSVRVTVHQFGAIIQSVDLSGIYTCNEGGDKVVGIKSNMTPKFSSDVDWAVPSLVEEGINVAISKNETGTYRKGVLSCTLGPEKYEIPIAQLDSTEVFGVKNWELQGVGDDGSTYDFSVTFTRKMTGYGVKLAGTGISWTFDARFFGNNIAIPLGTSIGRYKVSDVNYYVIPVVAEGTEPIEAGQGIDSGYFLIPIDKTSPEDKWSGKVENANLRFEFWTLASRPGASAGGFRCNTVSIKAK